MNEAKGKRYLAEAREVYVAMQSALTEYSNLSSTTTQYDLGTIGATGTLGVSPNTPNNREVDLKITNKFLSLIKQDIYLNKITDIAYIHVDPVAHKVTSVEYDKGGYTITINDDGTTTVVKDP